MTEGAYFGTAAEKECFEELGVEKYEIIATLDSRTSKICRSLDGKRLPVKEFRVGVTAPPFHPWCRSTVCPCFDDFGEKAGEKYCIPEDMSYEDWKEKFADGGDKSAFAGVDKSGNGDIINLYKGKGLSVVSDDDIAPNTVKAISEATKKVTSDFKILENYSEDVRFSDIVDGLAENVYRPDTGINVIFLDKHSFSNPAELLEMLKKDFISGKSYETDTIQSLVAHEMGHNAHVALALKKAKLEYGKPLSSIEYAIFQSEYNKIKHEIYLSTFDDETFDEIQNICIEQLGSIVKNNPNELIAQSFGNYYYGKSLLPIAKKIVQYFKKGLK